MPLIPRAQTALIPMERVIACATCGLIARCRIGISQLGECVVEKKLQTMAVPFVQLHKESMVDGAVIRSKLGNLIEEWERPRRWATKVRHRKKSGDVAGGIPDFDSPRTGSKEIHVLIAAQSCSFRVYPARSNR